jgi:hypothetical protein
MAMGVWVCGIVRPSWRWRFVGLNACDGFCSFRRTGIPGIDPGVNLPAMLRRSEREGRIAPHIG